MLITSCVGCEKNKMDTDSNKKDNVKTEDKVEDTNETTAITDSNETQENTTTSSNSTTNNTANTKVEHKHTYKEKVVNATCTFSGTRTYTCSSCNHSYSKTIPKTKHSWAEATCIVGKKCQTCGCTEGDALGHNYSNYKCTRCGDEKTVVIHRIWTDKQEANLRIGDIVTFYAEIEFPNKPQGIIITAGLEGNGLIFYEAVWNSSTGSNNNIYSMQLTITDNMQQGNYCGIGCYATDYYGYLEYKECKDIKFTIVQN